MSSSSQEDIKPTTITPPSCVKVERENLPSIAEITTNPVPPSPSKTQVVASLKRKEMESSSPSSTIANTTTDHDDAAKHARTNNHESDEVLDLALTLGLQPQCRLEVQWDIVDDDTGVTRTHWWGATLLEHDGRTEDGVAVRVLDYDPYPDGGFPERSQEDVIIVGGDSMFNLTTESVLNYRREGEEETVVFKGEDGVRDIVNGILTQVMQNNAQRWSGLTAAQQASVADVVATQKERLIEALMARPGEVITSTVMKDILEQTLGPRRIE